jgi:predicted metal-dependent hydrolase
MEILVKDINVLVLRKSIKNIHLTVLPPNGAVRISVPFEISDDAIKMFIIKKYRWIKNHIEKFQNQETQTKKEFVSGESCYFKGKKYTLKVAYSKKPKIEIIDNENIYFFMPKNYSEKQKQKFYENFLRMELKQELDVLVPKWEKIINVKSNEVRIKKMKTRWGSCNTAQKRIWINLELIKKPTKHLEYVIVHELVHLLEHSHNQRFKALMSRFMPKWIDYRKELNKLSMQ